LESIEWCQRGVVEAGEKQDQKIKRVMYITDIQPKEREYGEGR